MRAAIYARYSSERQSPRSVADQIAACRLHADRKDWRVVQEHGDAESRGAHILTREGIQQLLAAAESGMVDVVLSESLDRVSRSQSHVARIWELLQWNGVDLVTLSEGKISELHVGLTGTMSALFLKNLREKTRRGLRARARQGMAVLRPPYGFAADTILDDSGVPIRGRRKIVPEQAAVVRRIFTDYAGGASARSIAAALSREGVSAPRGGAWSPRTLHTVAQPVGWQGMLHQECYIGRYVYGRHRVQYHPETGRRRDVPRVPDEWIVVDIPEWRIVSDELWHAVQDRVARVSRPRSGLGPRRKRPLTGLVRCGGCGSALQVRERGLYVCPERSRRAEGCPVSVRAPVAWVESELPVRLLAAVRSNAKRWRARLRTARANETRQRRELEKRLAAEQEKVERLLSAIESGASTAIVHERLRKREAEIQSLTGQIQEGLHLPVSLDDGFQARLEARILALARQSGSEDESERLAGFGELAVLAKRCTVRVGRTGQLHMDVSLDERACLVLDAEPMDPGKGSAPQ